MFQKNNVYLEYILQNFDESYIDSLLYELNSYLHYYGNHFNIDQPASIKNKFYQLAANGMLFNSQFSGKPFTEDQKIILSTAYVDLQSRERGILSFSPPWSCGLKRKTLSNNKLYVAFKRITRHFEKKSVKELMKPEFMQSVKAYESSFFSFIKNTGINALVTANDLAFFENISIKLAKQAGVPTFVYLHGLPARYNFIDDNRADYLMVWGDAIKENYRKVGFDPQKIIVTGHPVYSNIKKVALKSSLENILVITKAMNGTPHSDAVRVSDRTHSLFYLEVLKDGLKALGVKSARLRCHPSENPNYYVNQLTDSFYIIDHDNKDQSLQKTSLVVGPSSTFVFDTLNSGINYVLFEPSYQEKCLTGFELVAPFDGSGFIKCCQNVTDFNEAIDPEKNINWARVKEYTGASFSLEPFYNLI
jgi:hypothetical protein